MLTNKTKYFRELKEMNARQAKISVETMKEVQNDKTLKTKAEKDRRLREKKQNNTKKFMDERKFAQVCALKYLLFFCIIRIPNCSIYPRLEFVALKDLSDY